MFKTLKEDIRTVFAKDPAARSWVEVIMCYPGVHAIWAHRIASFLWRHRFHLLARLMSQSSRFYTGIEIHPGAKIGRRFFIDHGMGVVIGETAEIGDDVLLYQGVVLGGTTFEKVKRHPTLGNHVVVGTGAILLGPITVGENARVGANSVVVKSVPPGATVVGVPGRIMGEARAPVEELEHGKIPDPVAEAIRRIISEQTRLAERICKMETSRDVTTPAEEKPEEIKEIERAFSNGEGI